MNNICGAKTYRGLICKRQREKCPFHPIRRISYSLPHPIQCPAVNTGHSTSRRCQKFTNHPSGFCVWHRSTSFDFRSLHPRKQKNPRRSLRRYIN